MSLWSELQDRTLFKGHHEIAFQVVYSRLTQIVILFVGKHDDIRSCPSIDVKKTTTIFVSSFHIKFEILRKFVCQSLFSHSL